MSLATLATRLDNMTEPSGFERYKAPPGEMRTKEQDTASVDTSQTKIEDVDLTPLDAFFKTEKDLWKKWTRDIRLKDAGYFAVFVQELLIVSFVFEFCTTATGNWSGRPAVPLTAVE